MHKKFLLTLLLISACNSYEDHRRTVLTKEKEKFEKLIIKSANAAEKAKEALIKIFPNLENILSTLIIDFFSYKMQTPSLDAEEFSKTYLSSALSKTPDEQKAAICKELGNFLSHIYKHFQYKTALEILNEK